MLGIEKEYKEYAAIRDAVPEDLRRQRDLYANEFLTGIRDDVDAVLSGSVVYKVSWLDRLKYNIKYYLNRIFNAL